MTTQKLEIKLHDNNRVVVSRTDTGAIYLELYQPGMARDGHSIILKDSALLTDETRETLVSVLASPVKREAA